MLRNDVFTIPSFLTANELELVESSFLQNLHLFQDSQIVGRRLTVGRAERQIRSSRYMIAPDDVRRVYVPKLARIAEEVAQAFGVGAVSTAESGIEAQMTISDRGDFFRRHNDSTDATRPDRSLSYVHYVHSHPTQFSGGELVVEFDGQATVLEPKRNLLVIFPSILKHEVRSVGDGAVSPLDKRITVNGWIHAAPPELSD